LILRGDLIPHALAGDLALQNWAKDRSTLSISWPKSLSERLGRSELIDHQDLDSAGLEVDQQTLDCGTLKGAARIAAIVVLDLDQPPAFMPSAPDVGFTRFPLGMQGVEFLLQPSSDDL